MGQIIRSPESSLSVCPSVCLSVCLSALSRSQFLTDFDEIWRDIWNLIRKNPFVGGQYPIRVSPIFTQFSPKLAPT